MTRKRFNVVTIAAMIAILALGSLGLGYASWSTNVNATVNATGGSANVDYIIETTREYMSQSSSNWGSAQSISYAGCDAAILDANNLQLNVTNMFPGYRCEVVVDIKNTGTVPVEANGVELLNLVGNNDPDLGVDGVCAGAIAPGATKTCTASIFLNYADMDFQNQAVTATIGVKFTQSAP